MTEQLGYLAMVTVTRGPYDRAKLAARLQEVGFDVDIPAQDRPVNAYKKATSAPLPPYVFEGQRCVLTMVETANLRRRAIVRTFTRTTPGQKQSVKAVDVLEAKFWRAASKGDEERYLIRLTEKVTPKERPQLKEIKELLEQRIHDLLEQLDGDKVRNIIRDLLVGLHGVPVRTGVYFVGVEYADQLHGLQEAFDVLPGCVLDLVPLLDTMPMRQMLARGATTSLADDFNGLASRISHQNKVRRTVSTILHSSMHREFAALTERWLVYSEQLRIDMPADLERASDVAFDALEVMRSRIEP